MGLYEAEFLGAAKPVKKRAPKVVPVPEAVQDIVPPKPKRVRKPKPAVVPETVPVVAEAAPPKKERKKKVAIATPPPSEGSSTSSEEPNISKKRKGKEPAVEGEEPPVKKVKKAKKIIIENGTQTTDEPPLWFKTWHLNEAKRLNSSKAKAEREHVQVVKEAAHSVAATQWSDGYTRDKIRHEQDNHQSRLYQMVIFCY